MRLILRSGPDFKDDDVDAVVVELLSDSNPIKLELFDIRSASIVLDFCCCCSAVLDGDPSEQTCVKVNFLDFFRLVFDRCAGDE